MINYYTEVFHNKGEKRFEIFLTLFGKSYRLSHTFEYFLVSDMLIAKENANEYSIELLNDLQKLEDTDGLHNNF